MWTRCLAKAGNRNWGAIRRPARPIRSDFAFIQGRLAWISGDPRRGAGATDLEVE